jgi:membrane protease YdiL (CAAX protease family)
MSALLFSFLPPYRVLMVWIYERTGSLLLAMLMHASLNIFWLLAMPVAITGVQQVIWYFAWAAGLWIVVAVVAVADHQRFSRQSFRSQVA